MTIRSLLLATALLAAIPTAALAQVRDDVIATPVLRANVIVSGDLVRIGDVIDNAGTSARIAIYRAPDLGTHRLAADGAGDSSVAGASGDRPSTPAISARFR